MEIPIPSPSSKKIPATNNPLNRKVISYRRRVVGLRRVTRRRRVYLLLAMIILAILCILLGVLLSRDREYGPHGVIVDVGYAKYRGWTSSRTKGVSQWLGIRYAAPPLGDLRFRAPQPPENFTGIQDALVNQPICIPTSRLIVDPSTSEDCLFLNVFAPTPHHTIKRLLPVYIFIQGGGFNANANPWYDGSSLIKASGHEIVVVTFNYRVGPYGFLTSKEVQADGDLNVGLLDQRAVFKWVQDHIGKFGGNASHVTIGGDSAGAASIDHHLTAFGGRDEGLFHAAAAESQSFGPGLTVQESQYQYDALIARTGCDEEQDTLACLRDLDVKELQAVNTQVPYPGLDGSPLFMYSAVIDGDYVPDSTYRLFAEGKFIKVPVIFGDVTNEGTIFAPQLTSSYAEMNFFLKNNFPNITTAQLEMIDSLYGVAEQFPGTGEFWRTAANAYGEMRYNCPGIFLSSVFDNAGVAGNWNYHYNVTDPSLAIAGLGVPHAIEITAIFGGYPFVPYGTPSSYAYSPNKKIISVIQAYWTSFIRTYDPNTYRLKGSPVWERFSVAGKKRILFEVKDGNGGMQTRMETVDPGQAERCEYLSSIGSMLQQ